MEEDSTWDTEDFKPPVPPVLAEWAEEDVEVKENWFDEDEPETKPAEPAPTKAKPEKKQKSKPKATSETSAETDSDKARLSEKDVELIQKTSDLSIAKETFGLSENASTSIDKFVPQNADDFETLRTMICDKLKPYEKMDLFPGFIGKLFTELCLDLDSEHVRKFSKELSALAGELSKAEKEREKSKQPKMKKKVQVKLVEHDFLADVVAGKVLGDYEDDVDYDDFI
ncbi:unnamed protein product [Soboliphyme baturini]|uniref:Eukaryotic translation initiation factor 3 30 kDa subunit n=1 Tax=Soboliphyme baturini TaxID=241478 RepID=A0A183J8M5_9BILA|nr:unnamed protein product [Soboliphyme baturini]